MNGNRMRGLRLVSAALFTALALALAGCSVAAGEPGAVEKSARSSSGGDGAGAAKFAACLTSQGVQAKIDGDSGLVFVQSATGGGTTGTGGAGAGDTGPLAFKQGDDGQTWVAAKDSSYFTKDPETQKAYAACESQVPGFTQSAVGGLELQQAESNGAQGQSELAFAQCARKAGFTWVADPSAATNGGIRLPLDITEDEFRSLLTACYKKDGPMISFRFNGQLSFDYLSVLNEFTGNTMGGTLSGTPLGGSK